MSLEVATRTWQLLENAIRTIFDRNSSSLSYEELYRNAYNMVNHEYGGMLYGNVETCFEQRLDLIFSEQIMPHDDESELLRVITNVWQEFRIAVSMVRECLMYMDKNFDPGNNKPQVLEMGMQLFRSKIVEHEGIWPKLTRLSIDIIQRDRLGENVNRMLLRDVVTMLAEVGCYKHVLEDEFLKMSRAYYRQLAIELTSSLSVGDYLKKVDEKMHLEGHRIEYYLVEVTRPLIEDILRKELLESQISFILDSESGFKSMLRDERHQDAKLMFHLLGYCDTANAQMRSSLKQFVYEVGKQYVNDKERQQNPISFTQGLIELKNKFDQFVAISFEGAIEFVNTLNAGFEEFINSSPQNRIAEFLSLFVDEHLRQGGRGITDTELEINLESAMVIFRAIQDKDVFEKYYKMHLSKRLLSAKSGSDDAERSFLSKLKKECGFQFTSKLESMFNDMRISEETNTKFKRYLLSELKSVGEIDFFINILTTGSWPQYQLVECVLPPELQNCFDLFKSYYTRNHTGRKLSLMTGLGEGIVIANFRKTYELTVNTTQIAILMLFNNQESYTYQQIQSILNIPTREVQRSLLAFCNPKNPILLKEPKSIKPIKDTDVFTWNKAFKCNHFKIRVGTLVIKETTEEQKETRDKIEQDRKPQIEAAIVRIMKSRKLMHHSTLLDEVVRQCSGRFKPSPADIKNRIESLIEREFLKRSDTDRKTYEYLA